MRGGGRGGHELVQRDRRWVADVPGALLVQLYRRPAEPVEGDDLAGGHRRRRRRGGRRDQCVVVAASQFACRPFGENPAGEAAGQGGTGDGPAHHHHDHHDHGDHHDHDAAAGSSKLLAIAVDGKTVRGATDAEGNQSHLLAAATHHDALVLGQVEVGAKTNEIPMFAPLLDQLAASGVDLAHSVITADTLHAQRSHAQYLHERGAGFIHRQAQPARPVRRARCAALDRHPDRPPADRPRPRPDHQEGDPALLFPSGHAAMATAVALTAVLAFRVAPVGPRTRLAVASLTVGYVLAIAVARLVETVHPLTDVLGGVATGLVVTLGAALALTAMFGWEPPDRASAAPGR